ncbi:MAG: alpha/beta fold hydrolase, partial [Blastocatellia bacterium]
MGKTLVLLSLTLFAARASCAGGQGPTDLTIPGKAFINQLASGDFDGAVKTFDGTMRPASPPEKLREMWAALAARLGPFKQQTAARQERQGAYQFVFVTCQFEKDFIDVKLVYNSEKQISGMWFVPAYKPPPYARPDSFTEKDVQVGSGEWVLPGTLTVPAGPGPFPGIVLVHGSGPNDRDESLGPNKPFRDIAWGLASKGIAVLRYDKRSKVFGSRLASIKGFTVKDETIDDALAAVALLRQTPGIDANRVFVLGHSLGGMVAPRVAAQDDRIAGLVILAGSTRPVEQLLVDQLEYLISLGGPQADTNRATLAKVKQQLERLKDPKLPENQIVIGAPPSYWHDIEAYNPGAVAASLKIPILVLQGERDYQVTLEDFAGWKKYLSGRRGVEFKTYPKLNHLFEEGEGKS